LSIPTPKEAAAGSNNNGNGILFILINYCEESTQLEETENSSFIPPT